MTIITVLHADLIFMLVVKAVPRIQTVNKVTFLLTHLLTFLATHTRCMHGHARTIKGKEVS